MRGFYARAFQMEIINIVFVAFPLPFLHPIPVLLVVDALSLWSWQYTSLSEHLIIPH